MSTGITREGVGGYREEQGGRGSSPCRTQQRCRVAGLRACVPTAPAASPLPRQQQHWDSPCPAHSRLH